jgi:hypothetical protein
MDIPNDLNKLLARLQEVTRNPSRMADAFASGSRPSAIEIDFFLSQYSFDSDAMVERFEVANDGVFEFYMFAVSNRFNDELSLLTMWPKEKSPAHEGETG